MLDSQDIPVLMSNVKIENLVVIAIVHRHFETALPATSFLFFATFHLVSMIFLLDLQVAIFFSASKSQNINQNISFPMFFFYIIVEKS